MNNQSQKQRNFKRICYICKMEIKCSACLKIFIVDNSLIPENGRLVQCGYCKNEWFYKYETKVKKNEIKKKLKIIQNEKNLSISENIQKDISQNKFVDEETSPTIVKKKSLKKTDKKSNINHLKMLIVTIITLIAVIILLDTFKYYLKTIFPDLENILQNFYETLKDISLFFKDLTN